MEKSTEKKVRIAVFIILLVITLALHLMPRPVNSNAFSVFYNSYLINIILPCYLYIMLTLNLYTLPPKIREKEKLVKILMALSVLFIGFTVETLQYFGVPIFGSTFDPIDYLAYSLGIIIGLIIDYYIVTLSRKISPIT